jgi:hypothetical protein
MGGITVQAGNCVDGNPRLSLTPEGLRLLSFLGRLPRIHESQIRDKSKADGLAKTIVCLQAGWMVLQTIARLAQHLPITLLEINTNGHVLCALALYLLWWSKPLEVKDPILLPHEEWMDPYISLMWMCSPISGSKDDEISEMRCMAYSPPNQRQVVDIPAVTVEANAVAEPLRTHETHFSLGSTGARDPRKCKLFLHRSFIVNSIAVFGKKVPHCSHHSRRGGRLIYSLKPLNESGIFTGLRSPEAYLASSG